MSNTERLRDNLIAAAIEYVAYVADKAGAHYTPAGRELAMAVKMYRDHKATCEARSHSASEA